MRSREMGFRGGSPEMGIKESGLMRWEVRNGGAVVGVQRDRAVEMGSRELGVQIDGVRYGSRMGSRELKI